MTALLIIAILLALSGLTMATKPPTSLRRAGARATRRIESSAEGDAPTQPQLTERRMQAAWHDALGKGLIWAPLPARLAATRTWRTSHALSAASLDATTLLLAAERWLVAHAGIDRRAQLSPRVSRALKTALVLADIAIVSAAIRAHDTGETVLGSMLASSAIGIAVAMCGQLIGTVLKPPLTRLLDGKVGARVQQAVLWGFIVASMAAAAGASWGLGLLRAENSIQAWLLLALTPAVGSAIVVILGPGQLERDAWRAETELNRAKRSARKTDKKLARAAGLLERSVEVLRIGLKRDGELTAAQERALLPEAAIDPVSTRVSGVKLADLAARSEAVLQEAHDTQTKFREQLNAIETSRIEAQHATPRGSHDRGRLLAEPGGTEEGQPDPAPQAGSPDESSSTNGTEEDWHVAMFDPAAAAPHSHNGKQVR